MRYYSLENKSYKWLLYLSISQIVLYVIAELVSSQTGHSSLVNVISATLDVLWLYSIPVAAIIAGNVAHKMNRPALLWGIFTLFLSPIALVILSYKKNYLSPKLVSIYQKYEIEYLKSISELKIDLKNGKISDADFNDKQIIIRKEIELEMNQKIQEKEAETYEYFNNTTPEISEYNGGEEVNIAYEKCPACGSKVALDDIECHECGLRLK